MAKQKNKKQEIIWSDMFQLPSIQDIELSAIRSLVPPALSAYSQYVGPENLPLNQRLYAKALSGNAKQFTENDLTPEEQYDLQNMVLNNYNDPNRERFYPEGFYNPDGSSARASIPFVYTDYPNPKSGSKNWKVSAVSTNDPSSQFTTTLGRFTYEVDPNTNDVFIKDKYDFNNMGLSEKQTLDRFNNQVLSTLSKMHAGDREIYNMARLLGSLVLPDASSKGVPVNIRLTGRRPSLEDPNRPGYSQRPINPALDIR